MELEMEMEMEEQLGVLRIRGAIFSDKKRRLLTADLN